MPDEERAEAEPTDSGVFGKLPSARPGVRSPRRGSGAEKGGSAPTPATSESTPAQGGKKPPPSAPRRRSPEAASPGVRPPGTTGHGSPSSRPTQPGPAPQAGAAAEPEAHRAGEGAGVEDLAWAGITVAAEAATLGVRLLSRALEAVRGPADRR